ncbi:multidrug ABC transporter permease, partial [Escherichia coli]|nr:multidrug ABC transporter permease [Escherichia coli]
MFCALFASVITTVAGLVVPLFTKNLIDGFSIASLDVKMIALIVLAFVLQAITNGFSIFLLNYMGQKVVATIR